MIGQLAIYKDNERSYLTVITKYIDISGEYKLRFLLDKHVYFSFSPNCFEVI